MNKYLTDNILEIVMRETRKCTMPHKYVAILIDKKNRPVSYGYNYITSDFNNKWSYCAEWNCIFKCIKQQGNKDILHHLKLMIVRVDNGKIIHAYPCQHCQNLIKKYGIPTVLHTIDNIKYN